MFNKCFSVTHWLLYISSKLAFKWNELEKELDRFLAPYQFLSELCLLRKLWSMVEIRVYLWRRARGWLARAAVLGQWSSWARPASSSASRAATCCSRAARSSRFVAHSSSTTLSHSAHSQLPLTQVVRIYISVCMRTEEPCASHSKTGKF